MNAVSGCSQREGASRGEEQGDPGATRLLDRKETGQRARCQEMALGTFRAGKKPGSCWGWDIPYGCRQESSTRVLSHSGSKGDIMRHEHSATESS